MEVFNVVLGDSYRVFWFGFAIESIPEFVCIVSGYAVNAGLSILAFKDFLASSVPFVVV